jgi:Putative adhesin
VRSPLTKKRNLRQIAAVLLLSLAGCDSQSDRVLEETFDRLYTIQPASDISVQNRDGAVLVYGANTNEIRVHTTKKAYSYMRLKEIAISVSVQSTSVSINAKFPPSPRWALFDRSGTVDYTIVVPATANISQLHLDAGEVLVDGMHGRSVHAWLGDGRMSAHNCFTDVDVALQRGNLAISYDWWEHGTLSVQANTARGNAWVFLPSEAAFHLVAETRYGKIANDFDKPAIALPTSAHATKIDMLAHGGGTAAIKVRTENGDIKVMAANP